MRNISTEPVSGGYAYTAGQTVTVSVGFALASPVYGYLSGKKADNENGLYKWLSF